MRTVPLTLLAFLFLPLAAMAQPAEEPALPTGVTPAQYGRIVFHLDISLSPTASVLDLPVPLMERLANQGPLSHLELAMGTSSGYTLRSQFLFWSMVAFSSWYQSEEVQALLRELEAQGQVRLAVNLEQRLPNDAGGH